MNERHTVAVSVLAAFLLAGSVTAATESPAVLAQTPLGAAIYLLVGVAAPQYALARRTGSDLRLGVAALAAAGGGFALIAGGVRGSVVAAWGTGFVDALAVVVLGVALGAVIREFYAGYRAGQA